MNRNRKILRYAAASAFALFAALPLFAQTTGSIEGAVQDESGGALPGVSVSTENVATGLSQNATTNARGRYAFLLLPPSDYAVSASLDGFAPVRRTGIRVPLGVTVQVDFAMRPSDVKEQIVVTGVAPVVETTSADIDANINETAIKTLPLNGRDFTDLVALTPGTVLDANDRVHVGGSRGIQNNFQIDGADSNSSFFGEQRGGVRPAYTFSQEAIQEFQVVTSSYNAQYGRATGGIINAITKSGTNDLHGSVFGYFQNESFVEEDAFAREQSEFERKQYGFTLGGPIVRDRLHFFVGVDIQDRTDPRFRDYDPTAFNAAFNRNPTANQAFLDSLGLNFAEEYGQQIQTNDVVVPLFKLDWQVSEGHRATLRDNFSDQEGINQTSNFLSTGLSNNGFEENSFNSVVGSLSSVLSDSAFNEVVVQYAFEERPRTANSTSLPEIEVGPNFRATLGQNNFLPNFLDEARWQFIDNFTFYTGRHTLRGGVDFSHVEYDDGFFRFAGGQYRFNSYDDFFARRPRDFTQSFSEFNGAVKYDTQFWAVYAQDEWKIVPGLTLNLGLRYDFQDNPDSEDQIPLYPDAETIPDDDDNWAPRLGIAWDPANDGKSVVRAGAGIFYSTTPSLLIANALLTNGVRVVRISITPTTPGFPTFPNRIPSLGSLPSAKPDLFVVSRDFENTEARRASLGYERQILPGFSLALDLVYSKWEHLEYVRDVNLALVGTTFDGRPRYSGSAAARPNSNFNRIQEFQSDGEGTYQAVTLSGKKRMTSWWQADFSYTYAEAEDDNSNERSVSISSAAPEDMFHPGADLGPSDSDVKHNFIVSSTLNLPLGFWVGLIFNGRSGDAYSAQDSRDINGDTIFTDRSSEMENCTGETATNLTGCTVGEHFGRNTFRQPDYKRLDLSLGKTFHIGFLDVTLIGQVFNATNHHNKRTTRTTYGDAQARTRTKDFGTLNTTAFNQPRQYQIGARIAF